MKDRVYHIPVMLDPTIEGLNINPNGTYVDVTFGGGGHSNEILKRLEKGKLLAFDQDPDALKNALDDDRFTLIPQNFRFLENFLKLEGVRKADGILADLGVSSHQFDEGERGFSIRFEGPLDMRMNPQSGIDAKTIVNTFEHGELARILRVYGEVQNSGKIASGILKARETKPIKTTSDLVSIIEKLTPKNKERKVLSQVFQAIRIVVNGEIEALEALLEQSLKVLKPGGRLVIISYHSLEDRLVKNFFRSGNLDGKIEKDFYGNIIRPIQPIQNKAIMASEKEITTNSRSKSARLRIAEKT